jgi:branched-chain amino acid transport system ATP-binding protein
VFNIVSGLDAPSSGTVRLRAASLVGLPPHEICRLGVARTFQNTEVFRRLTALDNVLVGLHSRLSGGLLGGAFATRMVRREEAAARERARALLARLGLERVADVESGSLPLGQQKRLEIARALASEPTLLLLDEPAGGLNPTETRELMDVISALRSEGGLTLVVVEHDMELVMGLSDRVAVLHYGRTIAEGSPRDVATDAAVIEAYLGAEGEAAERIP